MASNSNFFYSKVMPKIYGIGAAVVILGAMFKILDLPGASWMIGIGLSTEALIFFLSAFEPIHKEVDWSKVYPELNEEEAAPAKKKTVVVSGDPIAAQLDNMLAQANIGPELIESLGKGMQNLASSAEKMGNLSDAAVATTEYAAQVQTASKTLASMSPCESSRFPSLAKL